MNCAGIQGINVNPSARSMSWRQNSDSNSLRRKNNPLYKNWVAYDTLDYIDFILSILTIIKSTTSILTIIPISTS
jgi:hypothetical protein